MISNTTQSHSYAGTGAQFTFAYGFRILTSAEIAVVVVTNATGVETLKAYGSDYALSNVGADAGGNVVFAVAPLATETVIIYRNPAFTQPNDWTTPDAFSEGVIEDGYDRAAMGILAIKRITDKLGLNWKQGVLRLAGGPSIYQGTAPPATGPWKAGDIAINTSPTVGSACAWFCVSGGTPGSWAAIYGSLSVPGVMPGGLVRPRFSYNSTTSIKIGPGAYDMDATSGRKTVYWDTELTFTLGPGGSNGSSSALGASQWQYIFVDDIWVTANGPKITAAAGFINSTAPATWDAAKHGWYNNNYRCIFAVRTTAASLVRFFAHSGDTVHFADPVITLNAVIDSSLVDLTLTCIPAFSRRALVVATGEWITPDAGKKIFYWLTKGEVSGSNYTWLSSAWGSATYPMSQSDVIADAVDKIQVIASAAGNSKLQLMEIGYKFDVGT